jgi:heme/copper-type cytochrome/quinol oxidase subunit 4
MYQKQNVLIFAALKINARGLITVRYSMAGLGPGVVVRVPFPVPMAPLSTTEEHISHAKKTWSQNRMNTNITTGVVVTFALIILMTVVPLRVNRADAPSLDTRCMKVVHLVPAVCMVQMLYINVVYRLELHPMVFSV